MTDIARLIEDSGAIKWGKFKLSDGSLTDYYIDKYVFNTNPELLSAIVAAIADRLEGEDIDAVAGPALGAVPLVTALSLRLTLPAAYLRKGETHRGTQARIEGRIEKGNRVAVIEDVTSTGGTILDTASVIEETGGSVERLIVVVDRNEGAIENVANEGYELDYLLRVGEDLDIESAA